MRKLTKKFKEIRQELITAILEYITEVGKTELTNMPDLNKDEKFIRGIDMFCHTPFGKVLSVSKVNVEPYHSNALLIKYQDYEDEHPVITEDSSVFSLDELWFIVNMLDSYDEEIKGYEG